MTSAQRALHPGGVMESSAGSATRGSATPGTGSKNKTTPEGWWNLTHLAGLHPDRICEIRAIRGGKRFIKQGFMAA
ncbi:hypothetical protein SAMN02745181_0411 [Rubritalea squalenifaciens DSM 18772]|uniref:Uncharacterized protein n=1 Tax=Rubritalea squalenifaciens DSM 18772 TaxID=1123071 RepID=A0A1M6C8F2_9BACT|nr:hypothetical protein [Rubritalea squalenifaciens]SHI57044.1 hypothetical protein SAMN02745181_0411 [Rubritalea squalenifaciens DSM 18772]